MIFFENEIDKAVETFERMFKEVGWETTYNKDIYAPDSLVIRRKRKHKYSIKDFIEDLVENLKTHYPQAMGLSSGKFKLEKTSKGIVIRLRPEVESEYTELKRKNAKNKMQNGV